jgi:hypothetical protein
MSSNNPLRALSQQIDAEHCTRDSFRIFSGPKLCTSLAAVCFLLIASGVAPAADLGDGKTHYARTHRHIRATVYYGCRTGWWQSYWAGMPRPHWATRCS